MLYILIKKWFSSYATSPGLVPCHAFLAYVCSVAWNRDLFVCFWFLNVRVNNEAILRTGPNTERLTILRAATHEIRKGRQCLSRSHTDTNPTSRERESNPGPPHQVSRALPTELPRPPGTEKKYKYVHQHGLSGPGMISLSSAYCLR